MEIELDAKKTVRQNLQERYAELRKLKDKKAGLLTAIEETKKEIAAIESKPQTAEANLEKKTQQKRKSGAFISAPKKAHWYDHYLTFSTSGGRRVVAGADAAENDELYVKHLGPNDLFFHADIQGAPTVILKGAEGANASEKEQVAQFAAAFSSAWKVGAAAVDVYALPPSGVSKHATGGYVGRGGFALSGEREWFRQTPLLLKVGWLERKIEDAPGVMPGIERELVVLPARHPQKLEKPVLLSPGPMAKEDALKRLTVLLGAKAERIAPLLPSGRFDVR